MCKVLSIGAHNDEIMADMGGTAYLLGQKGCEQKFLSLAALWNDDQLPNFEKERYKVQETNAAQILGGEFLSIGNREALLFTENNEIIEKCAEVILDFKPDIVFIHWRFDNHTEHREAALVSFKALCVASVRGARVKEVYAYHAGIGQTVKFNPDFGIDITGTAEVVKRSLMCFDQNFANGKALCDEFDVLKKFTGGTVGLPMADTFKIVKLPFGNDDFLLKQLLKERFKWNGSGMYPAFGDNYF